MEPWCWNWTVPVARFILGLTDLLFAPHCLQTWRRRFRFWHAAQRRDRRHCRRFGHGRWILFQDPLVECLFVTGFVRHFVRRLFFHTFLSVSVCWLVSCPLDGTVVCFLVVGLITTQVQTQLPRKKENGCDPCSSGYNVTPGL